MSQTTLDIMNGHKKQAVEYSPASEEFTIEGGGMNSHRVEVWGSAINTIILSRSRHQTTLIGSITFICLPPLTAWHNSTISCIDGKCRQRILTHLYYSIGDQ